MKIAVVGSRNFKDKQLFIAACNFIGLLNETKEQWQGSKKRKINIYGRT